MDRKEYDANLGLQEGRRKNPGQYKLPKEAYAGRYDWVFWVLLASALLVGLSEWEFLWNLLKSALAVVTSAGR